MPKLAIKIIAPLLDHLNGKWMEIKLLINFSPTPLIGLERKFELPLEKSGRFRFLRESLASCTSSTNEFQSPQLEQRPKNCLV